MEVLLHTWERPSYSGDGYKPFDIVIVKPDGWPWSKRELREFVVIRVPDNWFTAGEWRALWATQTEGREDSETGEVLTVQLRQRRYCFSTSHLTQTQIDAMKQRLIEKPVFEGRFLKSHLVDKEVLDPRFSDG